MVWFKYIGDEGDHTPNGNFHFRGKNFDVDGTPKELTDKESIAKARSMPQTFAEVGGKYEGDDPRNTVGVGSVKDAGLMVHGSAQGDDAGLDDDADELDGEGQKTGKKSKKGK